MLDFVLCAEVEDPKQDQIWIADVMHKLKTQLSSLRSEDK
jgi:hypothetical protein